MPIVGVSPLSLVVRSMLIVAICPSVKAIGLLAASMVWLVLVPLLVLIISKVKSELNIILDPVHLTLEGDLKKADLSSCSSPILSVFALVLAV